MSRKTVPAPPDPAPSIARALNRRLPDRIRGAGTLFLWLRPGRAPLRVAHPVPPRPADFARTATLHSPDVLARSGWLLDQLAQRRFTSFHFLLGKPAPAVRS